MTGASIWYRICRVNSSINGIHMEIMTRKQALQNGEKYYFTGKPCKQGHMCKRHVTAGCYECTLAYQKKFRQENEEYWHNKNRRWNEKNKDAKKERDAEYRFNNSNVRKAQRLTYKVQKRQASKHHLTEFDIFVAEECQSLAFQRTVETGFQWHVDHMIPLRANKVSGLHNAFNLQVIPAVMNLAKRNRMLLTERGEWLR